MRIYISWDSFELNNGVKMWLIKRSNPKEAFREGELPQTGEQIIIDSDTIKVKRADYIGDSEFKWYPHILIESE